MSDGAFTELEAIERKIDQATAQIAEARRILARGQMPDLYPVQRSLDDIEDRFSCHAREARRILAGPLIGLHEEIEGMVTDLANTKRSVEDNLNATAYHERAYRAYARDGAGSAAASAGRIASKGRR